MANWYCSSVAWTAVTQWAASTAYAVGAIRRQLATPALTSERVFRCTTAGTSGTTEPSWNLSANTTTTDGSVTWTEITGQETYNTTSGWLAPFARLSPVVDRMYLGDIARVANNHAETQAATMSLNFYGASSSQPSIVECINPTTGATSTGAKISVTGGNNLNIVNAGGTYTIMSGLIFTCNTGTEGGSLCFGNGGGADSKWYDCVFNLMGSGGIFQGSTPGALDFTRCNFVFNNANQRMNMYGVARFKNCAIAKTGVVPNSPFGSFGYAPADLFIESCDLSNFGTGVILFNQNNNTTLRAILKDCKMGASVAIVSATNIPSYPTDIAIVRSSATGGTTTEQRYTQLGVQKEELVLVRTGGASDGITAKSANLSSYNASSWLRPMEALPLAGWNTSTGSQVTATVEGIANAATLPNNDDIWIDAEYLGISGSTQGVYASGTKSDRLATGVAQPASTAAWDSLIAARANSATVAVGAVVKVASNAGRVFFAIAAGTTAASEPAGFASAVDGGTVVDGGVTWRAGVRFKLQVPITPTAAGVISIYPKVAKTSTVFYIDPVATVA